MIEAPALPSTVMPIVRIAVLADSRLTEIALPAELPLREILPAVQRLVTPAADDAEVPGDSTTRLSLAPIGGAPFSLDASLDTVGVVDGDLLALRPMPAGPAAPGIVEDIADAAMIFSASRLKPWGASHIQRAALAASTGLVLASSALAVAHHVVTGEPAGLLAVGVIAVLTVLAAWVSRNRSTVTALTLSITALAPIAAASTLIVPGRFGPAQLMLGAAAVTAWSLICLIAPPGGGERGIGFFTAASVAGAAVTAATGVQTLWQLPLPSIGYGLVAAALLLTIATPQLSALWARLPLPVIPAPGDPTPSALPAQVLADLPRRVRVSDAHQTGLIAGAVLLTVLGSVAIALRPETLTGWAWYVVAAAALASILRARVWDSAWCKAWLLAQPYLTAAVLLICYAATGRYLAALSAVLVLTALVAVWAVVALNPAVGSPDSYSLPMRRLVGFLASGIDASLIPVMAYLVGIFSWILSR